MILAAIVGIPGSLAGTFYFLGVYTSLKFAWMAPAAPFIYSSIVIAVVLLLAALVMDYVAIRRAALGPHPSSIDPAILVEDEEQKRARAIEAVYKVLYENIARVNESINDLRPKPTPELTLKQRTMQLAHELHALLNDQGPEPPHPIDMPLSKRGTESQQRDAQDKHFKWKHNLYYKYMAHFRDRVVKIDYELASVGIDIPLDAKEFDPSRSSKEVDVKQIADTLFTTALSRQF